MIRAWPNPEATSSPACATIQLKKFGIVRHPLEAES
jgi:hypothetical protein